MARLVVLVGPRGCGKTTVCTRLADAARARGLRVAGLVSPGTKEDPSGRCARRVLDLATGEARPLGRREPVQGRTWQLDEESLAWGARAAAAHAPGADVFVVDEVGPLELAEGRGWSACVDLLANVPAALVVASVREECFAALRHRLDGASTRLEVVHVTGANRDELPLVLLEDTR
jgi:nucleoside-triphosphatase THEP1